MCLYEHNVSCQNVKLFDFMTNEEQENRNKPKKNIDLHVFVLSSSQIEENANVLQLVCYCSHELFEDKKSKYIRNYVFTCAVHTFTRTSQRKYCPTIHHYLFCIQHIKTHIPIPLLQVIQTFIFYSSLSYRSVWAN